MLPAVTISKAAFSSVSAPSSSVGVLAIAACSSTGVTNQPGGYAASNLAATAFGIGPLIEYAAYDMSVSNNAVNLIKGNNGFPGSYNGLNLSKVTGSSVISTSAAAGNPYDHYNVQLSFLTSGTIGVVGITYTYSLDGGGTVSGVQALGTANNIVIPLTGVQFNLAAGTIIVNDFVSVNTERPLMSDTDTTAALSALSLSRIPWEGVLIDSSCTSATVGLVDLFLSGLEGKGQFKYFLLNTRFKTEPLPTGETEAAYAAALQTTFGNSASPRGCVCADGAHVPSLMTGYNLKRATSILVGARASLIPIGEDPAFVGRGPIPGAQIADGNGNPFDHDEDLYPTLDSLRLTTLRGFASGGPQGVYICNANTIQASGGSFPYLQHVRIANEACRIAWYILTTQLGLGVRKNPTPDAVTGAVYIFEPDAAKIDGLVNDALIQPLKNQVSAFKFTLSRTDNLNNTPCIVTGRLSIVAFAYIKGIQVTQTFDKAITVAV